MTMEKMPTSEYKIRFNDCDLFGHLNNSSYLDYLINAREDHLAEHYVLDLPAYYKSGFGWVVSTHEINYLIPAVYNEAVQIQTSLIQLGEDHLIVEAAMFDKARTHLKAIMRTRLVYVSTRTGRKEKHPDEFFAWAKAIENNDINREQTMEQRIKDIRAGLHGVPLN